MKLKRMKGLGENINRLKITTNIAMGNKPFLQGVLYKIAINFYVLSTLMTNEIGCNINGRLTITMKMNWLRKQEHIGPTINAKAISIHTK